MKDKKGQLLTNVHIKRLTIRLLRFPAAVTMQMIMKLRGDRANHNYDDTDHMAMMMTTAMTMTTMMALMMTMSVMVKAG